MDIYVNKREQLAMISRARGVDFNTATLLDGNYMYFEIYFEIFRSHFFFFRFLSRLITAAYTVLPCIPSQFGISHRARKSTSFYEFAVMPCPLARVYVCVFANLYINYIAFSRVRVSSSTR